MKRRENRVYLQVLAALRLGCLAGAAYVLRADQVTTPDVWRGRSEGVARARRGRCSDILTYCGWASEIHHQFWMVNIPLFIDIYRVYPTYSPPILDG